MTSLDAEVIRQLAKDPVRERLAHIKVFSEIDSTNSYLMQMPAPEPGRLSVAVTNNQTAGRGRHGKTWQSPPGSGLCFSAAYTFALQPENLPALTLALGLGAIDALESLGASGIELCRHLPQYLRCGQRARFGDGGSRLWALRGLDRRRGHARSRHRRRRGIVGEAQ